MKKVMLIPALGLSVALFAGCSGGTSNEVAVGDRDFGTIEAGLVKEGVLDGARLAVASTGGHFQDGQVEAYWGPFSEISGADLVQEAIDPAKLKASVESGSPAFDLSLAGQAELIQGCGTLYEEVNWDLVDTSGVNPEFLTSECGVPNILYGTIVAYNEDSFSGELPTSAMDYFDTKKFPGKRGAAMTPWFDNSILEMALLASGSDLDSLDPADIDKAIGLISGLGDDLVPWTSGVQAQQQIESGEVAMTIIWSGRAYEASAAGAPVNGLWDKWVVMVDHMGVPKGIKDPDAAATALNFSIGEEQQMKQTELTAYSPVLADPPEMDLDPALEPWVVNQYLDTGSVSNSQFWTDNWDAFTASWSQWVSGVN